MILKDKTIKQSMSEAKQEETKSILIGYCLTTGSLYCAKVVSFLVGVPPISPLFRVSLALYLIVQSSSPHPLPTITPQITHNSQRY